VVEPYWLVVAMIAVAVVAVIIAVNDATDEQPPSGVDVPGQRGGDEIVVAVLAASDATGEGLADPVAENWVAQLAGALPAGAAVHNLGVGGSTVAAALRDQLPRARQVNPRVAVCWLAVNDLLGGVPLAEYRRNLDALLAALDQPGCRLIVGNIPALADSAAFAPATGQGVDFAATITTWNAAIAAIAAARGAELVDLTAAPIRASDLGPDGFHPSPEGHARLAAAFRPAVAAAVGGRAAGARPRPVAD